MKQLELRHAKPSDWPAIVSLHQQHQALQGTNYELPDLFGKHRNAIAVALVTVDENDEIQNVVYVERIAEMRFVGTDPHATAISRREIDGLAYLLRLQGYRWLECFVPRDLSESISKPLDAAGFACKNDELSHFTKDLREEMMVTADE